MYKVVLLRHGESVWNKENRFTGWTDVALSDQGLEDTVERFLPLWHETIAPMIKTGKRVIIAAHGNSLRALVKYLDDISDEDIVGLNIPTGIPLVYELDEDLKPIKHYYLGDQKAIAEKAQAVANQGKAKEGADEGCRGRNQGARGRLSRAHGASAGNRHLWTGIRQRGLLFFPFSHPQGRALPLAVR
jgi:hypothetical protein